MGIILTAGSVISSLSPADTIVLTRASTPPTWHTITLFLWLLHVRLESIPAAQVTMFTSDEPSSWTRDCSRPSKPPTLVPASERFLRVHRQFWTSLCEGCPKCIERACIPPASTIAGLLLAQTERTKNREKYKHKTRIQPYCCIAFVRLFEKNLDVFTL